MKKVFPVIAVVDDDPDDRLRLERAFGQCRQDTRVRFFETAESLLDYLEQSSEGGAEDDIPDLILASLHLKGKAGLKLISDIKSHPNLKRIPLVVLNGSPSDPEVRESYDRGANTVIIKPILFDELVTVLKILCDYWLGPVRM